MTAEFTARVPTLWHGRGSARRLAERVASRDDTLVISDAAVPAPFLEGCRARRMEADAQTIDAETVARFAREMVSLAPKTIVAVGGGTILDACKLAALALAPGCVFEYAIGHAAISALTFLPAVTPPVELVAVPTTLGTSSETNSVAVLKNEHGYRLIVGRSLRPRHAVIDPHNLSTLPRSAVLEGVLEAFLRLAGASTSARRSTRGNRDAVVIGRALLETAAHDGETGGGRLRLARLGAATQRSDALTGDDPYCARHWYVANEVAFVLRERKMVATAAVVAAVWRRICAGDTRWGDRQGLETFWQSAVGGMSLPLDPADGITALIDRWGIPQRPRPSEDEIGRISTAIESSWGDRRPMLRGLVADDFTALLRESRWSSPSVGLQDRPSTLTAKEVNQMENSMHTHLQFDELDDMEALSWESFYQGAIGALVLIGIGAAAAT
jgi:hypothetical protein